ncbi:MAG: phosphatidylserine decarboxylase [Candidatus Brocadiaceae bacterium]|nr:phosphatidylserine decarboxylase [Candidatus Brocadiaceae bacterium]
MNDTDPVMFAYRHQYIDRATQKVCTEQLYGNRAVRLLYSHAREHAPFLFRALTSARGSQLLGFLNYEFSLGERISGNRKFLESLRINLEECVSSAAELNTMKRVFERKIRYWECRPMTDVSRAVVSPSDSRVIVGSFCETSQLFLKGKFFDYEELLGSNKGEWLREFLKGNFAIFRLTPEKYHYNHTPVAGKVVDFYEIHGEYHACNPGAVIAVVTPYSKNRRVVTVIDTDVRNGTGVGLVAMIEVVALMIGKIVQCYSAERYGNPLKVRPGMFLQKGVPKSMYRPGSSTNVLIFQKDRMRFAEDLIQNTLRQDVESRFSRGFGTSLVETDIPVRSFLGSAADVEKRECNKP